MRVRPQIHRPSVPNQSSHLFRCAVQPRDQFQQSFPLFCCLIVTFQPLAQECGVQFESVKLDRKSTRLNSSHGYISYAVFCLKKKKKTHTIYVRLVSDLSTTI